MNDFLTLAEVAEASGVPARTIRFYIARGLLDGPIKAGRGAAYTPEHLARLERVKSLQVEGRTLSEIGRILGGVEVEPAAAGPTAWWQHAVADDVVVWTRADMSPWRTRQVRAAIGELARLLGKERKE
jgi:DNA-binding transcriptional MerR regulator